MKAVIEELKNPEDYSYETDFNCDVILDGLGTARASAVLEGVLSALMNEVDEIIHYRKRPEVFYRTIIRGGHYSIDIKSGLGSGYGGGGPSEFYRVLQKMGIDENVAKIVFETKYDNAV